jgi:COP9 signalosome complex subunit 7
MRALDMPSVQELEDLIINAIYLDILKGELDQKHTQLEVEYTIGHDLEPGNIESVLDTLKDW